MADTPLTITELLAEFGTALAASANANADRLMAEEQKKIVLARVALELGGGSVQKGEMMARASRDYDAVSNELVAATRASSLAYGRVEHLRARLDVWRTRAATARALKQIGEG